MSNQGVLLIGATGRTGSLVLTNAIARGLHVTALVRNPAKLTSQKGLTIVKGSPTKVEDILTAISASPIPITAIMVTLNAQRASDSPFAKSIAPPRLMVDTHLAIIAAMKDHPEIKKMVTLSAFGVGDSLPNTPWLLNLLFRHTNMAAQFADHDAVEVEVKKSGVPFVLVKPMRLTDGEEKKIRQWENQGKGMSMMASISRDSVAKFLVDAVESHEWDNKMPVISN